MIPSFAAQLEDAVEPSNSDASVLAAQFARLSVRSFYFYKDPRNLAKQRDVLADIILQAIVLIERFDNAIATGVVSPAATPYCLLMGLTMAGCALVRLIKSPALQNNSYEHRAREAGLKASEISKRSSVEEADLPARSSIILSQLLTSHNAFIYPDSLKNGAEPQSVPLRERSRLAMSHVLDCWAWWREEFEGNSGAYTAPVNASDISRVDKLDESTLSRERVDSMRRPPLQQYEDPRPTQDSRNAMGSNTSDFTGLNGNFAEDDLFVDLWSTNWPDVESWGIPGLS